MNTQTGTDINQAVDFLKSGAVIGIPTETVYGLAGNAFNEDAVLKIFEAKNRPHFDPLIVHTDSLEKIALFTENIPEPALKLFQNYAPGPLTLLLKKNNLIPDIVTSGLDRVAVRIPAHPLTLQLLRQLSFPLAAPSANPFGYISPTTAGHVYEQLKGKIPYILDGGACNIGVESTIAGIEEDRIKIYRPGGITAEALKTFDEYIEGPVKNETGVHTPGHLKSHYAPHKKFIAGHIPELIKTCSFKMAGILSFSENYLKAFPEIKAKQWILSPQGDINEAAVNLFNYMHLLDQSAADLILAEWVPDKGLGSAINNRLEKAAGKWQ